ncbi:hypothetical protein GF340_00655 [Candidatus Peregrinibacteria bacterium]|nr:hypothetical protein [Candidatus Peregrinibacteria bacterium]
MANTPSDNVSTLLLFKYIVAKMILLLYHFLGFQSIPQIKKMNFFKTLYKAAGKFQKDHADQLAASIAYFTVFSLAPLMVVALGIAGFVIDRDAVQARIFEQMDMWLGENQVDFWKSAIDQTFEPANNLIAILISVGVLLFISLNLFQHLKVALNRIFKMKPKIESSIKRALFNNAIAFLMVTGMGFLIYLIIIAESVLSFVGDFLYDYIGVNLNTYADLPVTLLVIFLIFAIFYRVLPSQKIHWKNVFLGAGVSSVLFVITINIMVLFINLSSVFSVYGAGASLIITLFFIFLSAQIFLFGAEVVDVSRSGKLKKK